MTKQAIFFGLKQNDKNHSDMVYTELDRFNETSLMMDSEITTFGWTIANTLNMRLHEEGCDWFTYFEKIVVRVVDLDTCSVRKEVSYDCKRELEKAKKMMEL